MENKKKSSIDQYNNCWVALWKQTTKDKKDADGEVVEPGGMIFYSGKVDLFELLNWANEAPEDTTDISFTIWDNSENRAENEKAPHLKGKLVFSKPVKTAPKPYADKEIGFGRQNATPNTSKPATHSNNGDDELIDEDLPF